MKPCGVGRGTVSIRMSAPTPSTPAFSGLTGRMVMSTSLELAESVYPAGLTQPRHGHDPAYFTVVISGGYRETIAHRATDVEGGAVLFHERGEEHAVTFTAPMTRILRVLPTSAMMDEARLAAVDLARPQRLDAARMRPMAARLARELHESDAASPLALDALACELIVACRDSRVAKRIDERGAHRAREVIESALAHPPSLAELARIAGCHPVTLTRAFRRTFGCAIGTYVRRRRVEVAVNLLRSTREGISAIAAEAGFADQAHLTRALRRAVGTTPAALRRTLRPLRAFKTID